MRTAPLAELADLIRGVTFKPADVNSDGVGVMRTKNVQDVLELSDIMRIPPALVKRPEQYLQHGDTLISSANSWYAVGRACWIPEINEPLAIGGFVTALRPRSGTVDPRYLYRWFTSPRTQATLRSFGNKTTNISNLNLKLTAAMEVPLPALPEQRRIAAILDHTDALRAKRRHVLARLDSMPQSIFHEMFGGVPATKPMSAIVEEFRYGTSNKSGDAGYPTLRIPNVIGGAIDTGEIKTVKVEPPELRRLTLRDGDLLFVRTNGNPDNVGRSAIFSQAAVNSVGFHDLPWIYASYLIRARLSDGVEPRFVAAFLAGPEGRAQLRERSKTSAGQYNINTEALGSLLLPSAPLTAQREFARRVGNIEKRRKQILAAQVADDELFASLQSRAFRGEL